MTTTAQQPATPGGTPDPASGTRRVRPRHTKPTAAQTDPFQRSLPVAEPRQVLSHARMVLRHHRGELSSVIGLHALAAMAGLALPYLIGRLIDDLMGGATAGEVDRFVLILLAAVIAQTVLMWLARRAAFIFGESVFADLRERFIDRASRLPLPVLERAGTGDLVARTTNDIEALSWAARFVLVSPLGTLAVLAMVPFALPATTWYLRQARNGYLWERAMWAQLNGVIAENAEAARTIDALALGGARHERLLGSVRESYRAECYTRWLRMWWFAPTEFSYVVQVAAALLWCGWLVHDGSLSVGGATTVILYLRQLIDRSVIGWLPAT